MLLSLRDCHNIRTSGYVLQTMPMQASVDLCVFLLSWSDGTTCITAANSTWLANVYISVSRPVQADVCHCYFKGCFEKSPDTLVSGDFSKFPLP